MENLHTLTHPLLAQLPENEGRVLQRQIQVCRHARGAMVFAQGESARGLYFIDSGLVQFRIDAPSGDSTFIGIAREGDYLGDCELLANKPHFAVMTALTDCTISLLPRQCFLQAMQKHATFANAVAIRLAKNLRLLQMVQVARHQMSIEQNIAGIITYLAFHFGTQQADGTYHIDVALSQDQLADMGGVTRQSIHKPLQAWKNAGWIDYHYGNMVIRDMDALLGVLVG